MLLTFEENNQAKAKAKSSGRKESISGLLLALMTNEKNTATTRKLVEFIALDDQLFSVVEDQGFRIDAALEPTM